ncbi:hypothetical protein LXL04_005291 [Taraxacum kok-saghyz]
MNAMGITFGDGTYNIDVDEVETDVDTIVSHIGANTVYKWLYMLEYPLSPQGLFWRDNIGTPHILTWYQSQRFAPPWPSTSLFRLIEPPALRGSVSVSHIGANTVYKWLYMLEYPLSPQGLFWRDNLGAPHTLTLRNYMEYGCCTL